MGRRAHQPDPAQRKQVQTLAAYGIPEADISKVVGIDPKTLRKHYRDELDLGETKANAQVAGFLFKAASNGNVTAQIFWLKTRARWKETPSEHWHSGAVGTFDVRLLTDRHWNGSSLRRRRDCAVTKPKRRTGVTLELEARTSEPGLIDGERNEGPAAA